MTIAVDWDLKQQNKQKTKALEMFGGTKLPNWLLKKGTSLIKLAVSTGLTVYFHMVNVLKSRAEIVCHKSLNKHGRPRSGCF